MVYDHWKVTETDERGQVKRKYLNGYGKIIKVEEVNGAETYTTQYEYESRDLLTKITDTENNISTFIYDGLGRKKSQSDPDMGTWNYIYDNAGNLTGQTDNRNITTTRVYDELNRLTRVDYPSDSDIIYVYDGGGKIGTLTSVTDGAGSAAYTYDNRLRKVSESRTVNGNTKITQYSYDALDRMTGQTNPDGEAVVYTFNQQGEIESASGLVNNFDYDALGKIKKKDLANGLITNYTYNNDDFRLNRIQTGLLMDMGYSYDAAGNVTGRVNNLNNKTESFGYDGLERLISASETNGYNYAYTYNGIGNLMKFTDNGSEVDYVYGEGAAGPHALTARTGGEPTPTPTATPTPTPTATPTPTPSQSETWLSQGKTMTASTQKSGFEASKANDGNMGSYWEGGNNIFPATLTVDLGSVLSVNKVVMKVAWGGRTENVEILGSQDNVSFSSLVPAANYFLGTVPVTFTSTNIRYVRLKVNSNSGAPAAQIAEFEAWGGGSGGSTPTPTATPTPTPTATPTPTPSGSYTGQYFSNIGLSGSPALTRNDQAVDFDWVSGSPDPLIPIDNFSVRWTRSVSLAAGTYEFSVTADDGVRLWVDNELIIDKWIDQAPTTYTASKVVSSGTHTIKMEYYEKGYGAVAKLSYVLVSSGSNLALNKPVVSSSNESGTNTAAKAVDGLSGTRWASAHGVDPQWIYIDLGERSDINRVRLTWETAYGSAYQIQVSDNATNWTNIYTTTNSNGGVDDLTNLSGTGRYIRIHGTVRATQWGYSLWEIEVYGVTNNPTENTTLTYDPNGNMLSEGIKCFEYNEGNQLKRIRTCSNNQIISEYLYDYEGLRMVKKNYTNGTLTNTVVSWSDSYETNYTVGGTTENTTYYFANKELIAKKNPNNSKYFIHNDHLGSTSLVTNQAGTVVEATTYDPWGVVKNGGTSSKFLYTGQEYDSESSLHYYNARYYDSSIRRFTQPDDIIQDWFSPQTINRYSYVQNNPLKYTDPSGHVAWVPITIIGAGSVLGATEAVMSYSLENPNATLQQKVQVGASGAVIGGIATTSTLYVATSVAGVAVVGGVSSGVQQMATNAISKQPIIQANVVAQGVFGSMTSGVAAKVSSALKLVPNNIGRPIIVNNDRPAADLLKKNTQNAINKATVPDLIANKLKIIVNSIFAIFSDNSKAKKQVRK
jgi:RHS repeat-associated protein